jgi:hypothetical protein
MSKLEIVSINSDKVRLTKGNDFIEMYEKDLGFSKSWDIKQIETDIKVVTNPRLGTIVITDSKTGVSISTNSYEFENAKRIFSVRSRKKQL